MFKAVLPLTALVLIVAICIASAPDELYAQQSGPDGTLSSEPAPADRLSNRAKYQNIVLKRGASR
jgi:hypothetical protein